MPDVPMALSLLLANLCIIGGVLALSSTMHRTGLITPASQQCSICSTGEVEGTVADNPVCERCEAEYFETLS